jgi:thymidylate synthase (FAD)
VHRLKDPENTPPLEPGEHTIEDLIYFRPLGSYHDRNGARYTYTEDMLKKDKRLAISTVRHYRANIQSGMAEEHARGQLAFDFRQNFVVTFSLRAFMHFLTVRGKIDVQLECRQLCIQMLPFFYYWTPEVYEWFMANQWKKGQLAP